MVVGEVLEQVKFCMGQNHTRMYNLRMHHVLYINFKLGGGA
jgi:hypothetical protein